MITVHVYNLGSLSMKQLVESSGVRESCARMAWGKNHCT